VGSTQQVLFVVFDRFAKQPRAAAARQVTVVSPCRLGLTYCEDGRDGSCGTTSCEARAALASVSGSTSSGSTTSSSSSSSSASPPVLFLVVGSEVASPAGRSLAGNLTAPLLANASAAAAAGVDGAAGPLLYNGSVQYTRLQYGSPAPYSLLPCGSLGEARKGSCGTVAADAVDGDLSATIEVRSAACEAGWLHAWMPARRYVHHLRSMGLAQR
jgi:hypothetical protein